MAIIPAPAPDQRLVGTEDLGAFTADEDGSLGEKLQNIRDNLGAATLADSAPVYRTTNAAEIFQIAYFKAAAGMDTGGSTSVEWDATINSVAHVSQNGSNCDVTDSASIPLAPQGPSGAAPNFDYGNGAFGAVMPTNLDTLVFEFWAKWGSSAASADVNRGIGLSSSSSYNTSSIESIRMWRHSSNGWALTTVDGSTSTTEYEASDTSDSDWHIFRIELDASEARLYVDGTLKITKSTNLPLPSAGAGIGDILDTLLAESDTADATGMWSLAAWAVYWKAA